MMFPETERLLTVIEFDTVTFPAFNCVTLSMVETFRVPTLEKLVVKELKFEIEMTFRAPTLAVAAVRLETVSMVETFRVTTFARGAKTLVVIKRDVTLTTFIFDVPWARTLRVFRYGIVRVSKRKDVFVAFEVNAPFTIKVSETFKSVTFAVPRT